MTENTFEMQNITLEDFLCFSLYSTNNAMNKLYLSALKELGLTYPQYLVMVSLWEKDPLLVKEIGSKLFLESNTLTPLLKRLESNGLIERIRSKEDERQVFIHLTPSGHALEKQAFCVIENIFEATGLDIAEIRDLNKRLKKLRDQLIDARPRYENLTK